MQAQVVRRAAISYECKSKIAHRNPAHAGRQVPDSLNRLARDRELQL